VDGGREKQESSQWIWWKRREKREREEVEIEKGRRKEGGKEIFVVEKRRGGKGRWRMDRRGIDKKIGTCRSIPMLANLGSNDYLFNPLPYDVFRGVQPMAYGLFGPTETTTLSVLKTILMT
jgi:hypothetical protein